MFQLFIYNVEQGKKNINKKKDPYQKLYLLRNSSTYFLPFSFIQKGKMNENTSNKVGRKINLYLICVYELLYTNYLLPFYTSHFVVIDPYLCLIQGTEKGLIPIFYRHFKYYKHVFRILILRPKHLVIEIYA